MKKMKFLSIATILMLIISMLNIKISHAAESADYKINLSDLSTYTAKGTQTDLKTYTQDDFETFLADYNSGSLPAVYVTEFLFDGVGMVKTPDLDDFIEDGNDAKVKTLEITAINVNTTGNIEFSGEITGGMIAVDTNGRNGEINLILNNVKLDTDSKKTPAVYVYNKDITYTGCKVTIKTASGTKNYIEGGKFKKVSLVGSDELSNYTSKYSGDSKTWYETYTNYYGIYTSEQINNILFAKVQADNEDLSDGDPYYFYKAAGAISSDIDLYFEGTGYLEITSKNKEGVETKGNLTFSGGTGDYVIYAEDDCLNTTTDSRSNSSAKNTLTIDVKSLTAIVDPGEDSDEGDAIDSNGTLVINGGTIIAIAHPGQDAGLDSENGTYINGGTVLATGDMYDAISSESKQNFMVLSFQNAQTDGTLIALLDANEKAVMAYKTDRSYTNLVYSSADLTDGTYYLYKGGEIDGTETNGFYTTINSYTKGTQQGYSSTGIQGGMPGGMQNGNMREAPSSGDNQNDEMRGTLPSGDMQEGEMGETSPSGDNQNGEMRGTPPSVDMQNGKMGGTPPSGDNQNGEMREAPPSGDMQKGEMGEAPSSGEMQNRMPGNRGNTTSNATNKEFTISGISNQFSGVADYTASSESTDSQGEESKEDGTMADTVIPKTGIISISIALVVLFAVIAVYFIKKNKKIKLN